MLEGYTPPRMARPPGVYKSLYVSMPRHERLGLKAIPRREWLSLVVSTCLYAPHCTATRLEGYTPLRMARPRGLYMPLRAAANG